jgi:hypothetical protein
VKVARAGVVYFAVVFAAGFALGVIRTLLVVPRVGARAAELGEIPVMLVVSYLAARWVIRRRKVSPAASARLTMGLLALCLLVAAELALTLPVRGQTLTEYLASRDPVSGAAYAASLGIFALLPLLVSRRR